MSLPPVVDNQFNVTGFRVTGLTFVADGQLTGTMTPLLAGVLESVSEPATLGKLLSQLSKGLARFLLARKRGR